MKSVKFYCTTGQKPTTPPPPPSVTPSTPSNQESGMQLITPQVTSSISPGEGGEGYSRSFIFTDPGVKHRRNDSSDKNTQECQVSFCSFLPESEKNKTICTQSLRVLQVHVAIKRTWQFVQRTTTLALYKKMPNNFGWMRDLHNLSEKSYRVRKEFNFKMCGNQDN